MKPAALEICSDFPSLKLVRTGRWIRLFGKLTFLALALSIIGMVFLPWRQTARGTGTVLALDPQERPQPVRSPAKGIVKYVKPGLREGSFVEEGELLLKLSPFAEQGVQQIDTQIIAIESKEATAKSSIAVSEQLEIVQRSSGESLKKALEGEYQAAHEKWEQAKTEVLALQAELKDKRNKLSIAEEVAKKGLVSGEELFTKQQDVEAQIQKVLKSESAVEEAWASLQAKEEEIEAKRQDIDIKNREANQKVLAEIQKLRSIEKELIDLETKRAEMERLDVPAPRSGYIQQWYGLEGSETVKEGDRLFVIVPDAEELSVELKVSGNDMPLIRAGDHVRLQFQGWPAVQFVGWPSKAIGTFGGKVNRIFPTDDGKGYFRVVVTPEKKFPNDQDWPDRETFLRQGVQANGWVLLRQVTLGYEIWRQLNAFPKEFSEDEESSSGKTEKAPKVKLPKA